jgi:hypothetical protein
MSKGSAAKAVEQEEHDHFLAAKVSEVRNHLASLGVREVHISVTFEDETDLTKNLTRWHEPQGACLRLSDEWSEL